MMCRKYLILLFIAFLFSTCKKDNNEDLFVISILSTAPVELQEFKENISVSIQYVHPEGYIGFFDPDYLSLEVKDSRLSNPDYYHLIPVSPPNETISVQGKLLLEIDAPFVFGNGLAETLTYTIRIQDKDKAWSNKVTTSLITVNK